MTNRQRSVAAALVSLFGHAAVVAFVIHAGEPKPFTVVSESPMQEEKTTVWSNPIDSHAKNILLAAFTSGAKESLVKESVVVYYEDGHVQGAVFLDPAEAAGKSLRRPDDDVNAHIKVFDSGHPLYARLTALIERGSSDEKIEAVIAAFKEYPTFDTRYTTRASLEK